MTSDDQSRLFPVAERHRALAQRVAVVPTAPGVAFVPGRILVRGAAVDRVKGPRRDNRIAFIEDSDEFDKRGKDEGERWLRGTVDDPVATVELLRAEGLDAQLERVFFAQGCDPCVLAVHPSVAFGALEPRLSRADFDGDRVWWLSPFIRGREMEGTGQLPGLELRGRVGAEW